jgi:hypothetical protein
MAIAPSVMTPLGSLGKMFATALFAGTFAAAIEMVPVLTIQALVLGVPPARIFQSIASGVFGTGAYRGGAPAVFAGIALHWLISILAALVFVWTARRWRALIRHPVISGIGYGVLVYAVMTAIVVPLSAAAFKPNTNPALMAVSMVVHIAFFGLPIALATRWWLYRTGREP